MKNEHPPSLEQDDIVNSLNYEGIAVIELQFYRFPDSDRLRVGSSQTSLNDWQFMRVISQPPNRLHIIIVLRNAASIALVLRDTLCSIHANYNIRVTHRNGAIKHGTRIRSTEGSSADCSLFILSLHALALHLAVKILLQSFCMKI